MPTPVITSVTPAVHAGSKSKLVILGSDLPKNVRLVLVEPDGAAVEISEPRWFSPSKVIFRLSSRLSSTGPQTLTFQLFSDGEYLRTAKDENAFAVQIFPHPAVEKYRGFRVLPWKLAAILVGMILLSWLLTSPKTMEISASPASITAGQISKVMVEFSRPVDLENRHWFKLPEDMLVWDKTILSPTQCLLQLKTNNDASGERVIYLQGMNGSFVLTVAAASTETAVTATAVETTAEITTTAEGSGWLIVFGLALVLLAVVVVAWGLKRRQRSWAEPVPETEPETDPAEDAARTAFLEMLRSNR